MATQMRDNKRAINANQYFRRADNAAMQPPGINISKRCNNIKPYRQRNCKRVRAMTTMAMTAKRADVLTMLPAS